MKSIWQNLNSFGTARPAAFAVLFFCLVFAPRAFSDGCPEPAAGPDVWKQALLQIDQYRSTYVLMYADRNAERITSFGSPAGDLKMGAQAGAAVEVARKHGISVAMEYPSLPEPGRIAQDLLGGNMDGVVVWAPLAGWLLAKFDTEHQLSMHVAPEAAAPPQDMTQISTFVSADAVMACSDQVRTVLEAYGVVPAQAFQLDIFEVMKWLPATETSDFQKGNQLFQQLCASCHGQNAVNVSSLAPVNLLKTVRRSTYGGFAYMTLHGRNIKGMPGYHGILDREELDLLFHYIQQRSKGKM